MQSLIELLLRGVDLLLNSGEVGSGLLLSGHSGVIGSLCGSNISIGLGRCRMGGVNRSIGVFKGLIGNTLCGIGGCKLILGGVHIAGGGVGSSLCGGLVNRCLIGGGLCGCLLGLGSCQR